MRNPNVIAPIALATALLTTGCTGAAPTREEAASASASAAQLSAQTAHDQDFKIEVTYHPGGTREITFDRVNPNYGVYASILQYCIDTDTYLTESYEGGLAPADTATACQDMRIKPSDNLPVPGVPPR